MIPFKPLIQDRRSSTSSNHRPLDVDYRQRGDDDHNELDGLPQTREGHMFSIEDIDRDREDLDSQSRGTNDEYYYDEVCNTFCVSTDGRRDGMSGWVSGGGGCFPETPIRSTSMTK